MQMTNQDFGPFCSSVNTPALTSYDVDLELALLFGSDGRLLGFHVRTSCQQCERKSCREKNIATKLPFLKTLDEHTRNFSIQLLMRVN